MNLFHNASRIASSLWQSGVSVWAFLTGLEPWPRIHKIAAVLNTFVHAGRVRVDGCERLDISGPVIYAVEPADALDFQVLRAVIKRRLHWILPAHLVRGVGGMIHRACGVIAVRPSHLAEDARHVAEVLAGGEAFVLLPREAVKIAAAAVELYGAPAVQIVPVKFNRALSNGDPKTGKSMAFARQWFGKSTISFHAPVVVTEDNLDATYAMIVEVSAAIAEAK